MLVVLLGISYLFTILAMAHTYDTWISEHYASYRPPLHAPILNHCLGSERWAKGLDIGCGTGASSLALLTVCEKVCGIDPSEDMIANTPQLAQVSFTHADVCNLPFKDGYFDICTYAGAWWYAQDQDQLNDTFRILKTNGVLLIYDFEIHLAPLFEALALSPPVLNGYDHSANLQGFRLATNFALEDQGRFPIYIKARLDQVAHLVCASPGTYTEVTKLMDNESVYSYVVDLLKKTYPTPHITLESFGFYSLYKGNP